MREFLEIMLIKAGHQVSTAGGGWEAEDRLSQQLFDLVITDIQMPEGDGIALLEYVREYHPETVVIIITAFGSADSAVEAMKLGAYDYITKPFQNDEILLTIEKALENRSLRAENLQLKNELREKYEFAGIIGVSQEMQKVFDMIEKVKDTRTNVLIVGDSGTGKELVARAIHYNSARHTKPFVPINCGAIPENLLESELFGHVKGAFTSADRDKMGLFEAAAAGTLFLDEISELPLPLQVKLLRVLQERTLRRVGGVEDIRLDVRIISATNKDLSEEVEYGQFRTDLFYRLNVVTLYMPPLKSRKSDIPVLARHFVDKFSGEQERNVEGISGEAMELLMAYDFPGNVRELENIIERAVTLETGRAIAPESLPPLGLAPTASPRSAGDLRLPEDGLDLEEYLANIEVRIIKKAMKMAANNKKEAAKLLKIPYRSFRYRLEKYRLD